MLPPKRWLLERNTDEVQSSTNFDAWPRGWIYTVGDSAKDGVVYPLLQGLISFDKSFRGNQYDSCHHSTVISFYFRPSHLACSKSCQYILIRAYF